jgi:hypothetical protein
MIEILGYLVAGAPFVVVGVALLGREGDVTRAALPPVLVSVAVLAIVGKLF